MLILDPLLSRAKPLENNDSSVNKEKFVCMCACVHLCLEECTVHDSFVRSGKLFENKIELNLF